MLHQKWQWILRFSDQWVSKFFIVFLLVLISLLQYRLWVGEGSLAQIESYQQRLEIRQEQLTAKKIRNQTLEAEVIDLRQGTEAIEEIARYDLGLVKEGETFFQIIE